MHDMTNVYEKLRVSAEKDLMKASAMDDISPAHWAEVKTLLSVMCKLLELEEPEDMGASYRSYSYDRMPTESTRRARSARTGRFVSRDSWDSRANRGGYSGHSIKDRMIDQIERLYDGASTEHERAELSRWIDRIESEK